MKYNIIGNNRLIEKLQNHTFQRLTASIIQDAAFSTNDYTKVQIKLVLNRNGEKIQICDNNLTELVQLTSHTTSYGAIAQNPALSPYTIISGTLLGSTLVVDFKVPINISGTDSLDIEIRHSSGWSGGATASTAVIEYEFRQTIGNSAVIPTIERHAVQPGMTSFRKSLGKDLVVLALCSTNTTSPTIASTQQITNFRLSSDKLDFDQSPMQLVARRQELFETIAESNLRYSTFAWEFDVPLDNVDLNLTLNGANVNGNNFYVMTLTYLYNGPTIERAKARNARHDAKNLSKLSS
jgi:hypothetical protein